MAIVGVFWMLMSMPVWAKVAPCGRADQSYYTLLRCSSALERLARVKDEGSHGTNAFFQGAEPNVKRTKFEQNLGPVVAYSLRQLTRGEGAPASGGSGAVGTGP